MKRYTENQRQSLLQEFRCFDGTQSEFCRTHQLSMGTLQNWLARYRGVERVGFVELKDSEEVDRLAIEVGERRIVFEPRPSASYLAELLRALA